MGKKEDRVGEQLKPHDLTDRKGNLLLSLGEWYSIQAYVELGKELPATESKLAKQLAMPEGESFAEYKELQNDMLDVNGRIRKNSLSWEEKVYPAIKTLADDIVSYARRNKSVYRRLLVLSDTSGHDFDPSSGDGERFIKLLNRLSGDAEKRSDNAADVLKKIEAYSKTLQDNKKKLGKAKTDAANGYKKLKEDVKELTGQMEIARKALKKANEEYAHAVVVSATTPTYAWVFIPPSIPVGLIAAAVVAGIFGSQATDAQDRVTEWTGKLETYSLEQQRKMGLKAIIDSAGDHLDETLAKIGPAEQAVRKVQGVWESISKDLKAVVEYLKEAKDEPDTDFRALPIEDAMQAWDTVELKADFWRVHANIKVQDEARTGTGG